MGRVRAAGFRQRDLREAAGQHRRPAQGDRDFVFQGSGCRLGETGDPDRPAGRWQRSVWPVGHASQHYGTPISKTGPSPRTAMVRFSNSAYLELTTEWIMPHGELTNPNDS